MGQASRGTGHSPTRQGSTRRFFLQLLGFGAGLGWSCQGLNSDSGRSRARTASLPNRDAKILVVGAGVAGLAAAQALHRQGHQVLVLEGRNRLGGRIWTNRTLNNIPLDLGASWIHGTVDNPIAQLAQGAQLSVFPTQYNATAVYRRGGQRLSATQAVNLDQNFERLMERVAQLQSKAEVDEPLQVAIDRAMAALAFSPAQQHDLKFTLNTTLEHEYAADVNQLSLLHWDADQSLAGEDVLLPNGYDQILPLLSKDLSIQLEQGVTKIAYAPEGVEITTDQKVFRGDRAIITLPLGVLQKGTVQFSPPLPRSQQEAIQRLGMGVLNKVYLRFPQPFWDTEPDVINYIGARQGEWAEFLNLYRPTQQPILLGFNAGRYGRALEGQTDIQIVQAAMNVLKDIYGQQVPQPLGWLVTRWQSDPFAGGSYSFLPPGASPADRLALQKPVGDRLFFAGEATSVPYAATVHGAFLSGREAAARLLAVL